MAANKKFTPRASSNLIEEEVIDNKEEVVSPAEIEPAEEDKSNAETPADTGAEVNTTDEVTFTPTTDKKPIARMVKIRLAKKFDGCIGGTWYHLAKDQVVNVPENVKRILNNKEGMLKPL